MTCEIECRRVLVQALKLRKRRAGLIGMKDSEGLQQAIVQGMAMAVVHRMKFRVLNTARAITQLVNAVCTLHDECSTRQS